MTHRAHLFSLRIAHALRASCFEEPYGIRSFSKDLLAGISVGIIAIPLAMALAIASGVPPQYGLYTAIIAGFFIPLLGGSRFSVSGPTAAFVVILYPLTQKYGLSGLLIASLFSGVILILLASFRLGRFIEYIPESVTLGFTSGIAVVIATLQMKDFFGLPIEQMPEHYLEKVWALIQLAPHMHWPSLVVALCTFFVLLFWKKLRVPIPAHLPAVIVGSILAALLAHFSFDVATIGSTFHYMNEHGQAGQGIPPMFPHFALPWNLPGPGGKALVWNWKTIEDLILAGFAIAMLGAIESLLCAVILDGMSGKRHSANSELLGQGIGNLITPFFGGITATAAIARSAANFNAGAQSPIAAMVHALVVLLGLVGLAPLLAYVPMPAMAALLVVVAWNMSEAPKALHLLKTSPASDLWVFFVCFSLTVLFDMVIAITAGIVLAALLFIKEIAEMTKVLDVSHNRKFVVEPLPENWAAFRITGPLFFAAADRIFGELSMLCDNKQGIILHMDAVSILDAGGLSALGKLISKCKKTQTRIYFCDLQFQPLKTMARAEMKPIPEVTFFFSTLAEAIEHIPKAD